MTPTFTVTPHPRYPGRTDGPARHGALVVDGRPVSHADLIWVDATLAGARCRIAGVCNVITTPSARGRGYGRALALALAEEILQGSAELGVLFCAPARAGLYAAAGWTPQPRGDTRLGTPERYEPAPGVRVVVVPQRASRVIAPALASAPLYIPFLW